MLLRNHLRALTVLALPLAFVAASGEAVSQPRLDASQGEGHVILAQAGDPRIARLEEEIRRLTGQVEDLNFQLLQIQDQIRRMQEDNEFRFQQLEQGSNGAGSGDSTMDRSERPTPSEQGTQNGTETAKDDRPQQAEPPQVLGTITFDEDGNVVSGGAGEPVDLLGDGAVGTDDEVVAALPSSNDPDEIYRNAYQFILSGDYGTAEAGFRQYLEQFPEGSEAANANFWLGEALLAQGQHRDAAEVFLEANRTFPSAPKAPDMLLKLGVSLAALGQRDVACATYDEIEQRYPDISDALGERVRTERASAGC